MEQGGSIVLNNFYPVLVFFMVGVAKYNIVINAK